RRFTDGDPSEVVGNLPAGAASALRLVSDSVAARVEGGFDVAGGVDHDIQSVEVSDSEASAQVVDRITDRTYLVRRATGVRESSDEATVATQTWFLVRRDGEWKVIYFAQ